MISVLVPIYNASKYIEKNIRTLLDQTYKNIEIICINDGSTDNTAEILNRMAGEDSRVIVINKFNSGYGHGMNLGLKYASGDYIAIMEGDDFVSTDMLEKLLEIAEKEQCDVVKSDWYYYFEYQNKEIKANQVSANVVDNINDDYSPLLIQASIWSCLYKTEFLRKENINFLETPGASYQDTSFAFKCFALSKKTVLTDNAYLRYRLDNEQSSVNCSSKVWEITKEYDEIERFLKSRKLYDTNLITPFLLNMYKGFSWNITRIKKEFQEEFVSYFSKRFKSYEQEGILTKEFVNLIGENDLQLLISSPSDFLKQKGA